MWGSPDSVVSDQGSVSASVRAANHRCSSLIGLRQQIAEWCRSRLQQPSIQKARSRWSCWGESRTCRSPSRSSSSFRVEESAQRLPGSYRATKGRMELLGGELPVMVFPAHLQRSIVEAILDCPARRQPTGPQLRKPVHRSRSSFFRSPHCSHSPSISPGQRTHMAWRRSAGKTTH